MRKRTGDPWRTSRPRSWAKSPPRSGRLSRRRTRTSSFRAPPTSRGTARTWRNPKPPPRTTRIGTAARNARASEVRGASWSAGTNEESIRGQYDRATGAKDRLGWLQIGLNPAASYGFLQDDLVAGAVEIGIGDNSEYGGKNKSNFGFQGRLTNATVRIGKKIVVDKGRLAA